MADNIKKKNHKTLKIIIVVLLSLLFCHFCLTLYFTLSNYSHNSALTFEERVIVDQNTDFFSNFLYGGLGNVNDNGCGAIAVYNIMRLSGKEIDFAKVVRYFDAGGNFLYGKLGTNPLYIKWYLERYGFDVKFVMDTASFEQQAKQSKFAIYIYVGSQGGHYHLMHNYNTVTGRFAFINPVKTISLTEYLKQTENFFFKMLITVN